MRYYLLTTRDVKNMASREMLQKELSLMYIPPQHYRRERRLPFFRSVDMNKPNAKNMNRVMYILHI